jgi:hypothetical protein
VNPAIVIQVSARTLCGPSLRRAVALPSQAACFASGLRQAWRESVGPVEPEGVLNVSPWLSDRFANGGQDIPSIKTSLRSRHPFDQDIPSIKTSLRSRHPFDLDIPSVKTSLRSRHPFPMARCYSRIHLHPYQFSRVDSEVYLASAGRGRATGRPRRADARPGDEGAADPPQPFIDMRWCRSTCRAGLVEVRQDATSTRPASAFHARHPAGPRRDPHCALICTSAGQCDPRWCPARRQAATADPPTSTAGSSGHSGAGSLGGGPGGGRS